jgi:hypothetical protein
MRAHLLGATIAGLVAVAFSAVPAEAQRRGAWGTDAYDSGYRDGARAGGDDARDGRRFEYQRHRDYRSANGYSRGNGQRNDYADRYRAGFVAGYRDGYYSGGGRGPGSVGRGQAPWYGSTPGARRPSGYPGVADDIGYSNGFEEGYRSGLDDGRDRDGYDPRRHGRYRAADQGYRREYGPRGLYEASYRRGFERGYDQGYNEGERRRGGWRW